MAVIIEVKTGPMSGERIAIRTGETKTFGRAPGRANFALPHDTFMSGVHFAVECGPQGAVLKDRGSSNGTFLNGTKVTAFPLANGDEIRTGQTIFGVKLVSDDKLPAAPPASAAAPSAQPAPPSPVPDMLPPVASLDARSTASDVTPPAAEPPRPLTQRQPSAPPPVPSVAPPSPPPIASSAPSPQPWPFAASPASISSQPTPVPASAAQSLRPSPVAKPGKPPILTVGSWSFSIVPEGWEVKQEFGLEHTAKEAFPSSVTATEEMLTGDPALQVFVESQLSMLRQYLREPKIEAAIPPAIPGADEKASIDVLHSTKDGQTILYRRLYARSGRTVGTITLMTLEKEFASIKPAFDAIVAGIAFHAGGTA